MSVSGGRLRIRSRRGWDMTARVPELADCLPADVQLDGELIAWGDDGTPDFHRLGRRILHGELSVPITHMAFDVLALDGESTLRLPYVERHALLEEIGSTGRPHYSKSSRRSRTGRRSGTRSSRAGSRAWSRSASGSRTGPVRGRG